MNYNEFFTLYYSPHLRNYTEYFHNTTILNKNKKDNFRSFNNSNLLNETEEHYNNENITYNNIYNNNTYNNITVPDNNDIERPQIIIIHLSLTEILLFVSEISATNTIIALTFIHEDSEPYYIEYYVILLLQVKILPLQLLL